MSASCGPTSWLVRNIVETSYLNPLKAGRPKSSQAVGRVLKVLPTLTSHWNRLINELRKTDGVRRDAPWADLMPGEW